MTRKVYAKPPKAIFVAQLVLITLFMMVGVVFLIAADSEVRMLVAIFVVIWETACIAILVNAVRALKLMRNGKIEVAEISDPAVAQGAGFAAKLRELDALKKEGLVSDDEYQKKRTEIMQEKW
ncbi:MAG: hypothetical protein L3J03_08845 [Desulfobacterales bacterium]|nr:hypothetical protein [Desulfobacterales bacterium]